MGEPRDNPGVPAGVVPSFVPVAAAHLSATSITPSDHQIGLGVLGVGQGPTERDLEEWTRWLGFEVGATSSPPASPATRNPSETALLAIPTGSVGIPTNLFGPGSSGPPVNHALVSAPPIPHASTAQFDDSINRLAYSIVQGAHDWARRSAPSTPLRAIQPHAVPFAFPTPLPELPLTSPSRYSLLPAHSVPFYATPPGAQYAVPPQRQEATPPFARAPFGASPAPLRAPPPGLWAPLDLYFAGAAAGLEMRELAPLRQPPAPAPEAPLPPIPRRASAGIADADPQIPEYTNPQDIFPAPADPKVTVSAPKGGGRPVYWTGAQAKVQAAKQTKPGKASSASTTKRTSRSPIRSRSGSVSASARSDSPDQGDVLDEFLSSSEEEPERPELDDFDDDEEPHKKKRRKKAPPVAVRVGSGLPAPKPLPPDFGSRKEGGVVCGVEGCGEEFENWNAYRGFGVLDNVPARVLVDTEPTEYHLRHSHDEAKPFRCATCGKGFTRAHDMRRHSRYFQLASSIFHEAHISFSTFMCRSINSSVHNRNKPFRCECGAVFPRADALKRHQDLKGH